MTSNKISKEILLVDDHAVVLRGLTSIVRDVLGRDLEISIAASGQEVLRLCREACYRLCVFDVELPDTDGISLLRILRKNFPGMRVIVHTMHDQLWYIEEFVDMDVEGIVFKSAATSELIKAIQRVFVGSRYYCEAAQALIDVLDRQSLPTAREKEILRLMAHGKTTNDIAVELGVTLHAVEFHRRNLLDKFKASNTAELMAIAAEQGFLRLSGNI